MQYYILKTGMPMFDLERAYGLGLIVYYLTDKETKVFDRGVYYEIESSTVDYPSISIKKDILLSLVAEDIASWDNILQTIKKEKVREKKKEKALTILGKRCEDVLKIYSSISLPLVKLQETLLEPLELAATKGLREEIRCRKYNEGKELKISEEDWILTIIGALHSVIWQFLPKENENIAIIPSPDKEKGVDVSHLRDIKEFIKVKGINRISVTTLIAHCAVKLYQELWNRERSPSPWVDKFANFIYGSLVKTGLQLKPKVGGYFSLEFFEKLFEINNGGDILEHFDHILKISNLPGQEALAICCAEFLANPTFENYIKFINVYLRSALKKDMKIKRPKEEIWHEIIKCII